MRFGRRIVFADETVFEDAEIGYTEGMIWCYLPSDDLTAAFLIFSNPEKTSRMEFQYGEMTDVYEGYTDIVLIQKNNDHQITVALKRGES